MKPYRLPADPAQLVKQHLAAALAPVAVGLTLPDEFSPKTSPTQVVVFDDGGTASWPVATKPIVRVTVWGYGRTAPRAVAAQALGSLMSAEINGVAFTDPSAILETRDPNNGANLASFTVTALARTLAG